jgi:hypothetical protein
VRNIDCNKVQTSAVSWHQNVRLTVKRKVVLGSK